ncbi:hypothetical protein DQX05_00620 [Paenibacillus thiaminolyticus]|uniref:Uncharacterized protein n=1 Tax=Paenibacillus thiaminolyticus TaxID=49283 RepID=A0A3A3GS82_PANTH|nr:hypothetical protein DQX05_00620 [Paenibacillus thiaminolyticus]
MKKLALPACSTMGPIRASSSNLLAEGLKLVRSPYVYLTESTDLATAVGNRQSEADIIEVEAARLGGREILSCPE